MSLDKYFLNAQKEVFRLETLQIYDVPYNRKETKQWLSIVRELRKKGIKITRLHLLNFPLNEYKVFEIGEHKKQGAKVLTIDKTKVKIKGLKDFWIIDNRVVLLLNFDKKNRFVNYKVIRGKKVSSFVTIKDLLMKRAQSFSL